MRSSNIFFLVMLSAGSVITGDISAQRFNVSLLVNEQDKIYTAYHDEPVLLTISVMNLQAYEDQRWNRRADLSIAGINEAYEKGKMKREEYENEKKYILDNKRIFRFETIGTEENPWYTSIRFIVTKDGRDTVQLPFRLMKDSEQAKVAMLDTINSYFVLYGITPADLVKQQPGNYEISVEIAGVQSGKVVLNVRDARLSPAELKTEAVQMQFAGYYLNEPDIDKALVHIENILRNDSNSIAGLMLRGEIKIRIHDYKEALHDFERALKSYIMQGNKEAPEYIIGMVEGVRQKMAKGKH